MNLRIKILYLVSLLLLVSCNQKKVAKDYLIDVIEFKELSKNKNVKIIDFRKPDAYHKGHVKNALNITRNDIENTLLPYGGMMASKEKLEQLFSSLGINNNDTLIVYDNKGLCDAARLWWILKLYNFTNIKLVDGGLESFKRSHINFTKVKPTITPSNFTFLSDINNKLFASKKQIETAINNGNIIIDTRTKNEYNGSVLKDGAYLKGKIPTSQFMDWANAINYSKDKKTKTIKELESIYNKILPNKNDTIYVYCHSGVRSAHTTFVLTQILGYKNVKNYDGSWIEWSYYKSLMNENIIDN